MLSDRQLSMNLPSILMHHRPLLHPQISSFYSASLVFVSRFLPMLSFIAFVFIATLATPSISHVLFKVFAFLTLVKLLLTWLFQWLQVHSTLLTFVIHDRYLDSISFLLVFNFTAIHHPSIKPCDSSIFIDTVHHLNYFMSLHLLILCLDY